MSNTDDFEVPEGFSKMDVLPAWEFKENPVLAGVFVEAQANVGQNHSNLYTFRKKDGTLINVWGNTILDMRFKNLTPGDIVIIHYLGMEKSEKVKGRQYHNFEVFHKPHSTESNEDDV